MQGKLTFLDLRERYSLNVVQLADKSGVHPSIVYCMLLHRPVERVNAISVLNALKDLAGVDYGLGDVDIPLL